VPPVRRMSEVSIPAAIFSETIKLISVEESIGDEVATLRTLIIDHFAGLESQHQRGIPRTEEHLEASKVIARHKAANRCLFRSVAVFAAVRQRELCRVGGPIGRALHDLGHHLQRLHRARTAAGRQQELRKVDGPALGCRGNSTQGFRRTPMRLPRLACRDP
jgi:hypothetical protein